MSVGQLLSCKAARIGRELTRSWSWYQCGVGSSKILPAKGSSTSPKKSLRPNISLCHTVSHNVRFSRSDKDAVNCKKMNVSECQSSKCQERDYVNGTFRFSSNIGDSVCFLTFVLRLPLLERSGNKYTLAYLIPVQTTKQKKQNTNVSLKIPEKWLKMD